MRHPVHLSPALCVLLIPLAACGGKSSGSCSSDPVDGGLATVDGQPWTAAEVTWALAGDGVQLISTSEGDGWFSVVAQITTDGQTPAAALDAGDFPIEVTLKTGPDGGFATWYSSENEASATTQGGEGILTFSGQDDAGLSGCLAFTAGEGGAGVSFEDGSFTATER